MHAYQLVIRYALCNSADNDFKTNTCSSHPEKCHNCTLLAECLEMIENLIENLPENEKKELKYDALKRIESIYSWRSIFFDTCNKSKLKSMLRAKLTKRPAYEFSD